LGRVRWGEDRGPDLLELRIDAGDLHVGASEGPNDQEVEDGAAETPTEKSRTESNGRLTLEDEKPFRPPSEMLVALTERYSNIAIGKILDVSEAAVRMMLKRAGIRRANRVFSSLDDWQAAIIRGELKAELARKDRPNGKVVAG